MMGFQEFTETVLKGVCEKSDGKLKFTLVNELKNNGVRLTGISAVSEDSHGGPCVYLDGYYREYEDGNMEPDETADEVCRQIEAHQDCLKGIHTEGFASWKNIRGRVYAKMVNAGKNKEMLETVPHRMFLDMAAVYYVMAGCLEGRGTGTILIHNHHLSIWGQGEEELYQASAATMRSDGGAVFDSIENMLRSSVPEAAGLLDGRLYPEDMGMYVLTNRRKHYGASEILDKNTLRKISDKMKGSFIILPSSVHEVIVLDSRNWMECRELARIVQEINAAELSAEEYLSDHVYIYDRNEESLKIAA